MSKISLSLPIYLLIFGHVLIPLSSWGSETVSRPKIGRKVIEQQNIIGTEILINGRTIPVPWKQWQSPAKKMRLGISDTGLMQQFGLQFFSNTDYRQQSIDWYRTQKTIATNFDAKPSGQYRYIDITDRAIQSGWQWQIVGGKLQLTTPPTKIVNITRQNIPRNYKINVTLDRFTPWKLSQTPTEGYLTIEANADPSLLSQLNAPPPAVDETNLDPDDDPTAVKLEYKVTNSNRQTIVQFPIIKGQRARAKQLSPTTLEIQIDPTTTTIPDLQIQWSAGLKWRQQWVNLATDRFPVTSIEIDPRQPGIKIAPFLVAPSGSIGTNHLVKAAPSLQLAVAINGGYFNRNNRMPLGAIKRNGQWISSPILNRGAIAWSDRGGVRMARLTTNDTLVTATGEKLPLLTFNSAYAQTGIARYTPAWGSNYTPLQTNESIVEIRQNKVTKIIPPYPLTTASVPIPSDGYLLALRGNIQPPVNLSLGSTVSLQQQVSPSDVASYPHILGAGPWLVQTGRIVLDGKGEQFSDAFNRESAARSAIYVNKMGKIVLVAVHSRAGGKGPTLSEMAQLTQQLGAVDALNLDGGSSTSLYLGGQLIDRASATAARIHNGIGISISND
jgi:exopolysaccharide biosynthesis protein